MRSVKATLAFVILESLWDTVKQYVEQRSDEINKMSVSSIFNEMARNLSENPRDLPIEPNRRVTKYSKKGEFETEFPQLRNSLLVDAMGLQRLCEVYEGVAKRQFGEDVALDMNTLVYTVFYYFCKDQGLNVDEKYFSDDYFKTHYTYSDEKTLESLRKLAQILGKSPTSREWREHRSLVDGPSESYIINHFGSFNKAKELANLQTKSS